uniref:Uncharacterized protein n=1 Tax=Kalanchoe fedtschenkoi TaxID=63787 RepID=A0A7N0ZT05_KALFE
MPNLVGGDYMYYDSVDCFSTSWEDSASVMEGRGCEYEIWMNGPKSVEFRRGSQKKISKWWSQLCKKPGGKGAIEPALQMPKMNQTKVHRNRKKSMEFSAVYVGQHIKAQKGFILTMKFSPDGQYLASGGQDGVVRIWHVASKNAGTKYSAPGCDVFEIDEMPFQELYGHSGDILDLAWSKANRLLYSSKDKTARLWEIGSDDCLNVYYHNDYVTWIQFSPVDDKHFIMVDWVYAKEVVTAACYKPDRGGFVVGSVSGVFRFYGIDASNEHIQLEAQIHVQGRKKTSHNKITDIKFCHKEEQRLMITSEDSSLWNSGSQMSASFTSTGRHIISVGEDTRVYVWNYDYYHPSASKPPKSIDSCKHFFAEGVSVALPWSGRLADHNELLPSQQQQQQRVAEMRGAEGFSLGSWLSMDNQCCNGRVATWPEEQLPLYEALVNRQQDCRCLENGKRGLDGSIRTFHNFGLAVKP